MPRTKEKFDEMRLVTIEKIKQAGLHLFAKKGLAATNIKEIAKTANVSLGLIYHYYKSKDDLYLALANEAMDKSALVLDELHNMYANAAEKLEAFTEIFLNAVNKEDGIYYFILISQLSETNSPEENKSLLDRKLQSIQNLALIVKEGQKSGECVDGDAFQLAATFISATQGIASFKLMFGDPFPIPTKEVLLRTLLK
ncbi:TetR/AcrR family transcriptional regulator [Paenibacillus sp. sgz5001063]|uniref:TetR/AcrR family transcriptional regulator n=1 Tax=Paenibacillus sp. sgz5001063 TaxID=3242474 RepID=UPI0036D36472